MDTRPPYATTVKVRSDLRDRINRMAEVQEGHVTVHRLLEVALDALEEKQFWEQQAQAHAALQTNPKLRRQEAEERALWDRTLGDGLSTEPTVR